MVPWINSKNPLLRSAGLGPPACPMLLLDCVVYLSVYLFGLASIAAKIRPAIPARNTVAMNRGISSSLPRSNRRSPMRGSVRAIRSIFSFPVLGSTMSDTY